MKNWNWLLVACVVNSAGCLGEEGGDEELATEEQDIEVGSDDWSTATRNAVVLINGGCTGTLVAPNVVMTAGHCGWTDPALADGTWRWISPIPIQFGPDRSAPIATFTANVVSMPPRPTGAAPWLDDIVLLRLTADVPATVAVPRPMYIDRPATLSASSTIYQVGYGGFRDRRFMSGRNYRDWTMSSAYETNGFAYTPAVSGAGIGDRGTNIEGGDSGGPMLLNSSTGFVMGDLSHWEPYGIATFGPGGGSFGRPSIRAWLAGKVPQKPDFDVISIVANGCTGTGGQPTVRVTVKNRGARTASTFVDVFHGRTDAPAIGTLSSIWSSTVLAPEQTVDLSFAIPAPAGSRRIDVLLDTTSSSVELDETNNHGTATVTLPDCSFN